MNKGEKAEQAFLEVFRRKYNQGNPSLFAFDLIGEAMEVSVEPSRLHRLGNAILHVAGRQKRPYRPNYSGQLYPALARLEKNGDITSQWEEEPSSTSGLRRRLYRLAEPSDIVAGLSDEEIDPGLPKL
jgi:hypothetical protein